LGDLFIGCESPGCVVVWFGCGGEGGNPEEAIPCLEIEKNPRLTLENLVLMKK
jgi:hypothetical protein